MSEITIERINAFVSAQQPMLWESATKGLLLLAGVWLLALAMRKRSAAILHVLWTVALVALFSLPLLSVSLPEWEALPAKAEVFFPEVVAVTPPVPEALGSPDFVEPAPASVAIIALDTTPARLSVPAVVACLWLIGTLALLAKICLSQFSLLSIARPCERQDNSTVEHLRKKLGIAGRYLLCGSAGAMPMTWGTLRPKLLVPVGAEKWPAEKLEAVVLHELGHVKRWDALTNLVAKFACAVYWPNPFVWLASWRMHIERERACDDLVLASGVKPSIYADCLLQVATGSTGRSPDVAIAMAKKARIERRLIDILNESRKRRAMTWGVLVVVLLGIGSVVPPLAMLKAQEKKKVPQKKQADDSPGPEIRLSFEPESEPRPGAVDHGKAETDSVTTKFIPLLRADAGDVAKAISEAIDALPHGGEKTLVTADLRTNRILFVGEDAYFPFVKRLAAQFDMPVSDKAAGRRRLMELLSESRAKAWQLEQSGLGEKHPNRIQEQRLIKFLEAQIVKESRSPGSIDPKTMELQLELEGLKASGLGAKHPKIGEIETKIEMIKKRGF